MTHAHDSSAGQQQQEWPPLWQCSCPGQRSRLFLRINENLRTWQQLLLRNLRMSGFMSARTHHTGNEYHR